MSVLMFGVVFCSGCQSLAPFAKHSQQQTASARRWTNGGHKAFQQGRLRQAKRLFAKAADQAPNDFHVRANLARTMDRSGDAEHAILEMQKAVDLSGADPKLVVELGEMYLREGKWLPARRQVQLALSFDHRFAPAWFLSGKTEKAKGKHEKALADFQKALGYSPDLPGVQLEIVRTYQKMNMPLRALSAVEQILVRHPVDAQPEDAVIAKSVVLMDLNHHSTAIDILQLASEKKGASRDVFLRLSQAQSQTNQASLARLTLNRGKLAHPDDPVFDQMIALAKPSKRRVASNELPKQTSRY